MNASTPSSLPSVPSRRAALLFTLCSGGAVLLGCGVAAAHAVPPALWARNAGAWVLGALLAFVLARTATPRTAYVCLLLVPAAIAATFLDGGLSDVHRWIRLGPVRLNAAELLLPMGLVAWSSLAPRRFPFALTVPGIGLVLALQPDASQAVALAGAVLAIQLAQRPPGALGWVGVAVCAVAALISLFRPDPLLPVPEVEGILGLAWETSPLLALLSVLTLAGAVLSPLASVKGPLPAAAMGLAVYLVLSALAPGLGAFPVPLVGMGASPILGAWCGLGLLVGLGERRRV